MGDVADVYGRTQGLLQRFKRPRHIITSSSSSSSSGEDIEGDNDDEDCDNDSGTDEVWVNLDDVEDKVCNIFFKLIILN